MFGWLEEIERTIDRHLAALDVEALSGAQARDLVVRVERVARRIAGLRALAVGEVARKDAWDDGVATSPEAWVARTTGAGWGEATRSVELGLRLARMPETASAFTTGRISEAQAAQVARGAAADPQAERHLLRTAEHGTVRDLTAEATRVVARATDHAQGEQDRVHRTRSVRFGVHDDGAWTLEARLTKVAGARVQAALERAARAAFDAARREGRHDRHEAHLADALVACCTEGVAPAPSGPQALVEVRVDRAALLRGAVAEGEVCEIDGLGPIPIGEAERLLSDSILRTVLVDGEQVVRMGTSTRTIPKRLRDTITHRDRTCVVPGCDVSWNLEIDHRVPFSQGGATDEENLARLCHDHHRQKTAGRAILERWDDADGRPRWAWHPTSRPGERPPGSFEEHWPDTGTG
jgi:hypothetical protein